MLRVTIELVPDGDDERTRVLAQLDIANDDTGTVWTGHYDATITHFERDGSTSVRSARVDDFDRELPPLNLVSHVLSVLEPYRRTMAMGSVGRERVSNAEIAD